jgi:RNA polymerase sigma-70 factor (ECF subfamily)
MTPTRRQVTEDFAAMAEAELVHAAGLGQREACRIIMQRNNQRLFRVARAIVSNDAEAEDIVQESWMRAFAALDGFRGDAGLTTWLTRIVINEARGRLRRRRIQVDLDQVEAAQGDGSVVLSFPMGQPMENPEVEVARTQIRQMIEAEIDRLPEAFRLVFILREVQDASTFETADLLGIREETVKTRLHRARRLLREALDQKLSDSIRGSFPFLGRRCETITRRVLERLDGLQAQAPDDRQG